MQALEAIKPGPKPNKVDGTPDRRQRVTIPNKPNHPQLKPHVHKPGDSKNSALLVLQVNQFHLN